MSDKDPEERPSPRDAEPSPRDADPTGETLLGSGYGAGRKDIVSLVPPADDLGVGAIPVASSGDSSEPPVADPPTGSGNSNEEDGGIPLQLLILLAFAAAAIISLQYPRAHLLALGALLGAAAMWVIPQQADKRGFYF